MTLLKAVRGTRDLLPPETELWDRVEATVRRVFARYNFGEIRTPIFEDTQLFARGVGEETDIVSKEMYTWEDGERFNERKMIADWIKANESDDPTHVQAGRVNVQGNPPFLDRIKELGVQLQIWRGVNVRSNLLSGHVELVSFRPSVSAEAIAALLKARDLGKSDPVSQIQQLPIRLRLVIPMSGALNPWVDRKDVAVEPFEGKFFDSAQSLTLRPENTAGVVRAYIEHNLGETGLLQKLYYIGPQFRRERPQKGRYRQFWQIGAEVIGPPSAGSESPLRDAEVLEMLASFLDELGITGWTLEINSLGSPSDRAHFMVHLRSALQDVKGQMCADCQRRAETNALRVFDCKIPQDQLIVATLPTIADHLSADSREHFAAVLECLKACGIEYHLNPRLVRGLDYYSRTTFEFTHGGLGAQDALLGGGRYDGLSEMLGGPKAPGIGFAIGLDRLIMTLQARQTEPAPTLADVFIAPLGEELNAAALALARELRRAGLHVELGDGAFRLKKSFEIGEKLAKRIILLGEDEARTERLTVKDFSTKEQRRLDRQKIVNHAKSHHEIYWRIPSIGDEVVAQGRSGILVVRDVHPATWAVDLGTSGSDFLERDIPWSTITYTDESPSNGPKG
jgi:histidyl-tRNA synthetase